MNKEEPFASRETKQLLSEQTNLTIEQVNNWLVNERRKSKIKLHNH